MTKTCTKCGKTKNLKDFKPDLRYLDGHTNQCRQCINARNTVHHRTPTGWETLRRRRARAKTRRHQFALDDWLAAKF